MRFTISITVLFFSIFSVSCSSRDSNNKKNKNSASVNSTSLSVKTDAQKKKQPPPVIKKTASIFLPEKAIGFIWIADKDLETVKQQLGNSGNLSSLTFLFLDDDGYISLSPAKKVETSKDKLVVGSKSFNYPSSFKVSSRKISFDPDYSFSSVKLNRKLNKIAIKRKKALKNWNLRKLQVSSSDNSIKISISTGKTLSSHLRDAIYYWKQLILESRMHIENTAPGGRKLGKALNNIKITPGKNKISIEIPMDIKDFTWAIKKLDNLLKITK
ncbi:MAG: hypothetical protein JXR95_03145 [Deltaproteobacteria bacterium]|nr:hypothetical protein [Deltaproteobacteria bacterium]